jgi:hypothetical protein
MTGGDSHQNKTNHERNINMKKSILHLVVCMIGMLFSTKANAEVTYTLFSEDWEDGTWTGFSNHPAANTGIVNVGETIYGAPPTGAAGTYMTSASDGSTKNGKIWPMWWSPGDVPSQSYLQIGAWGSSTGLSSQNLLGSTITFSFQSYVSSFDPPTGSTQLLAFAKFFNADFSYYYDWASTSIDLALDARDTWVSHTITVTTPGDAATAQFGFAANQNNWSGGALNVDNMIVNVPEPTSASLLGLGLAGLLASRLRRRS